MFKNGEHVNKIDNLTKYNKVGDNVKVEFNVNTNEWGGRFFTSLQVWDCRKRKRIHASSSIRNKQHKSSR